MAVLLSDDFNRANTAVGAVGNPQIGPAPTYPVAGAWISSNQLASSTAGGSIVWDLGTPNVELSAQIATLSFYWTQLILSSGGAEGMVQWTMEAGQGYTLYVNGMVAWTRPPPAINPASLKVSYRDKAVRMYADDVLLGRVILDYALTGTKHGIRMGNTPVRMDNVLAVDAPVVDEYPLISGSVPTAGFSSTAATPTFLDASIYKGRDTKTLDANPGA